MFMICVLLRGLVLGGGGGENTFMGSDSSIGGDGEGDGIFGDAESFYCC
jgi:hypothetical protein